MAKEIIGFFRILKNKDKDLYFAVLNDCARYNPTAPYLTEYNRLEIRISRMVLNLN